MARTMPRVMLKLIVGNKTDMIPRAVEYDVAKVLWVMGEWDRLRVVCASRWVAINPPYEFFISLLVVP
jgi:hypothetical protein